MDVPSFLKNHCCVFVCVCICVCVRVYYIIASHNKYVEIDVSRWSSNILSRLIHKTLSRRLFANILSCCFVKLLIDDSRHVQLLACDRKAWWDIIAWVFVVHYGIQCLLYIGYSDHQLTDTPCGFCLFGAYLVIRAVLIS